MPKYLIHTSNGVGAFIEVPIGLSSDEFARIQMAFASEHCPKDQYATMTTLDARDKVGNVYYEWGLASADGCYYNFIRTPEITKAEVDAAKAYIKDTQDVVRMSTISIEKIVQFEANPTL